MLDSSKSAGLYVQLAMDGTNRSVVAYPCRDYKLLNFVCISPDSMLAVTTVESWTANGTREELLDVFSDFDEKTKTLLR